MTERDGRLSVANGTWINPSVGDWNRAAHSSGTVEGIVSIEVAREDWDALIEVLDRAISVLDGRKVQPVKESLLEFTTTAAMLGLEDVADAVTSMLDFLVNQVGPGWDAEAAGTLSFTIAGFREKMASEPYSPAFAEGMKEILLFLDFFEKEEEQPPPATTPQKATVEPPPPAPRKAEPEPQKTESKPPEPAPAPRKAGPVLPGAGPASHKAEPAPSGPEATLPEPVIPSPAAPGSARPTEPRYIRPGDRRTSVTLTVSHSGNRYFIRDLPTRTAGR